MKKLFLWSMHLIIFTCITFLLITILSIDGSGRTITVDDDGEADFTNIQDAIDAADPRDLIFVREGTYSGKITLNAILTLEGENRETTKIDGCQEGDVIQAMASGIIIRGFTIHNSSTSGPYGRSGVVVDNTNIKIENCHIYNCDSCISMGGNAKECTFQDLNLSGLNCGSLSPGIQCGTDDNHFVNISFRNFSFAGLWSVTGDRNTVEDSLFLGCDQGIRLYQNHDWIIRQCNFLDNSNGIQVNRPITDFLISGNSFLENYRAFYAEFQTSNVTLKENIFINNSIIFEEMNNPQDNEVDFIDNRFIDNSICMAAWHGDYGFFSNRFENTWLRIQAVDRVDENNTINGKAFPLLLSQDYQKEAPGIFDGIGGFGAMYSSNFIIRNLSVAGVRTGIYLMGCTNVLIENLSMIDSTISPSVYCYDCENIIILNSSFGFGDTGVHFELVKRSTIESCTFMNETRGFQCEMSCINISLRNSIFSNNTRGVFCNENSKNITITNNDFKTNGDGIVIENSRDCTIRENMCTASEISGIFLDSSHNCMISYNICSENERHGIRVYNSDDCLINYNRCEKNGMAGVYDSGIVLLYLDNCRIMNNSLSLNRNYGISLWGSDNCSLTYNSISENENGIYLTTSSESNVAQFNNIFTNSEHGIDASDNSGYAINATLNYWGDPTGPFIATENPSGMGDHITEDVEFDPWLEEPVNSPPIAVIKSISPIFAIEGEPVRFVGQGIDEGRIIGCAWRSNINGEFYNGTDLMTDNNDLSNGTHTISLKVVDDWGAWSESVISTLVVNGMPHAYIESISPEQILEKQIITFEGRGSSAG